MNDDKTPLRVKLRGAKVKICGIRSLEAALVAVDAGADFLGFNFVPTSKRYIDPSVAKTIIEAVKDKVQVVGVFQDVDKETIREICSLLSLDFVQLHGKETPAFCREIKTPVIKAFALASDFDYEVISGMFGSYDIAYYLIDRHVQGAGEQLAVDRVKPLGNMFPLFVAGGLTVDNVGQVVSEVQPFAVDVAGGIETDGKEDHQKIKDFVKKAKGKI